MRICDDLRKAVLQAAIQGKLTQQLPSDGNAADLLKEIAEKARLLKKIKSKKEKPLLEITQDDIPFDIPDNWAWVRYGSIITYQNGYAYKSSEMSSNGFPVIKSGNLMSLKVVIKPKNDYVNNPTNKMLESKIVKGDLLMCLSSQSNNLEPLGKTAIYNFDTPALLNQRVLKMRPFIEKSTKYLYYAINSEYFHYNVSHQGGGSAQANLKMEHVLNMILPLPPLTEQQRIVARVDELMARIDDLEKTETELEILKAAFPGDMKAALLQAAMQGKLTEQLPEDGDAADLINQIAKEKDQLIKEGKIKREKPLPDIIPDEVSFDIPENWKWCRFVDVFNVRSALRIHQSDWKTVGVPFLRGRELVQLSKTGLLKSDVFIAEKFYEELKCKGGIPKKDDVLITAVGTLGKVYVVKGDEGKFYYKDAYILCLENYGLNPYYIKYVLESPFSQSVIYDATSKGTTVAQLTIMKLKGMFIPLPPLAEQQRIVEKLDKLLPLCDGLVEE